MAIGVSWPASATAASGSGREIEAGERRHAADGHLDHREAHAALSPVRSVRTSSSLVSRKSS